MAALAEHLATTPDATMLGRLLVIQQTVDAMPDQAHIAAFVSRALSSLPGLAEVHVDIEGHTMAPDAALSELKRHCEREASPVPVLNFLRHRGSGTHCFPIDAPGQRLGWILVRVADEAALHPYLPFIGNLAGTIGRILAARNIHIDAFSIIDNVEQGMVRLMTSDPAAARAALKEANLPVVEAEVLAVEMTDQVGNLAIVGETLAAAGINIEYAYASTAQIGQTARLILRASNARQASAVLATIGDSK